MDLSKRTYRLVLLLSFIAIGSLRLPCLAPWLTSLKAAQHQCCSSVTVEPANSACCSPAYLADALALVVPSQPTLKIGSTNYDFQPLVWPTAKIDIGLVEVKHRRPRAPPALQLIAQSSIQT